jgi:hypothetical protein
MKRLKKIRTMMNLIPRSKVRWTKNALKAYYKGWYDAFKWILEEEE